MIKHLNLLDPDQGGAMLSDLAVWIGPVVLEVTTSPTYAKDYSNLELLLQDTELIVHGKVLSASSFCSQSGLIWTDVTIEVIDPKNSSLNIGDTMHIYEQKGAVSIHDYIESYKEPLRQSWEDSFSDYSDADQKTNYISQSDGTPLSEPGDESVYCLKKSAAWSTDGKTVYSRVGTFNGEYKKTGEDRFNIVAPNYDKLSITRSDARESQGYTLSELKTILHVD